MFQRVLPHILFTHRNVNLNPPPPPTPSPLPTPPRAGKGGSSHEDEYLRAVQHLGADDDSGVDMEAALSEFWEEETESLESRAQAGDFKPSNDLPLARIKRIMKSDEDVRMIAAEAPGACAVREETGTRRARDRVHARSSAPPPADGSPVCAPPPTAQSSLQRRASSSSQSSRSGRTATPTARAEGSEER